MLSKLDRIYLTGFMGAGKSTLGPILARHLGYEFVDLDSMIENHTGRSVPLLFRTEGEEGFRSIESTLLSELSIKPRLVAALGGGAILSQKNRDLLRNTGIWIYLRTQVKTLAGRLNSKEQIDARPLLASPMETLESRITSLLENRICFYSEAQYQWDTDSTSPEELASQIQAVVTQGGIT